MSNPCLFLPVPTLPSSTSVRSFSSRSISTRRRTRPLCSTPSPSDANFNEASLKLLQERLSQARQEQVRRDRQLAQNWRTGQYTPRIVAAVTPDFVRKLALEGDLLAMGTARGSVVLADLTSELRLTCRNVHVGQVTAVDYSQGVVVTAGSSDCVVMIWKVAQYERRAFWEARLLSGEAIDGVLHMPDMTLEKHGDVITAVKVDVGKKRVYSASVDGLIRVFHLDSGERLVSIRVGEPILAMKLTEKGYLLVGCASGRVLAYQADRGLYLLSMTCHKANTTAIDFWEETQMMVTGDSSGNMSIWSFKDSSFLGALPKHEAAVISVQMDSCKVIAASRDGSISVVMLDTLKRQYLIAGYTKYIGAVLFDDVRLIADGTNDVIICYRFDKFMDKS